VRHRANRDTAEAVALAALGWLAADEDRLHRFLAETGTAPAAVAAQAADADFLAGVLDHLLADETRLLGFVAAEGLPPELPGRLRPLLPGWAPEG